MRDQLPKTPNNYEFGVLNLDSSENSGTHWTLWFKKERNKFYFDSFGMEPPIELIKYLGGTLCGTLCPGNVVAGPGNFVAGKGIICSLFKIQEFGTNYCGHLCLFVLLKLLQGEKFENIILDLNGRDFTQIYRSQKTNNLSVK